MKILRYFVLLFLCFMPMRILAAGEFQADYDVQYAISPSGKTIVTQHVTLTNKLPNYYPKQYTLLLDSDRITNVIAYDDGGIITPAISIKDGKTEIKLAFNVKAIGLGKSSAFSLRYEHSGVASLNGSIWEVYIPGITNDPDIGQYNVTLAVPPTFGVAAYLSPRPAKGNTWDKSQMIRGGIAGAYGLAQNFSVTLTYALTNSAVTPTIQTIALPPDTSFQKVTVVSLSPKPETVERDKDGNWLATYKLLPTQSKTITAKLGISTFISPRSDFTQPAVDTSLYVKPLEFWQVEDPEIQKLKTVYTTPQQIYTYVSTTLQYNYSRIAAGSSRLGAVTALLQPDQAVCMEFTDLFIAIARAAGIPARRNVGYAYTNNPKLRPLSLVSDVLHAWPEYYDITQKIWIPVDPTWANTTGGADYFSKVDFNHIVFAIQGLSSSLPYPAGFYHDPAATSKDVDVSFIKSAPSSEPDITSVIEFPSQVSAGTTSNGAIVLSNRGGVSAYAMTVRARSQLGKIQFTQHIPELLPSATIRIPLRAINPHTLRSIDGEITVSVNDAMLTARYTVRPIVWLLVLIAVFAAAFGIVSVKFVQCIVWKIFRKH